LNENITGINLLKKSFKILMLQSLF